MIPWTLRWHWTIQIYTAERDTLVLIQDTCWGIPDRMILEYLKWRLSQTGFRLIAFVSRCIQSWLVVSSRRLAQSDIDWISINWDCLRPCHGQTHGEKFSTNNIYHLEHLVMTEDGVVMGAMLETTDTCLLSECDLYFDIWGKVAGTLSDKRRNE